MTNFAVLRVEPVKLSDLKGADSHQMRKHIEHHIDTSRLHFNKLLHGSGDLSKDALDIIGRYDLANSKTTTVAADMILTAKAEYFNRISPDWQKGVFSPELKAWTDRNMRWLKDKYGDGLASVVLHADESAVHLHAVVVPLCTYKIKFRRGEKEVTRINYRHMFSDDMAVIREARKNKNVDTHTKLGRLQTEYANALSGLHLVRGIRNSKATHQELKEYQRKVKEPLPPLKNIKLPEAVAPSLLHRSEENIKQAMTDYGISVLEEYLKVNRNAINTAMTKAKEHDSIMSDNDRLKNLLVEKDVKLAEMQERITVVNNELSLKKSEIDSLRAIDMKAVAERLSYTGNIAWRNAIDMVKELEGLEYKPALAWLASEFGLNAVQNTAALHAKDNAAKVVRTIPDVHVTKQQQLKQLLVREQLAALGSSHYRITMMSDHNPTYNVGKGKAENGDEKLYTSEEVVAMVPHLERKNQKEQYNVFITPIDEKKHYLLLDDLKPAALEALRSDGYKPNLIIESSKSNMQGIFILPKQDIDKDVGNAVFKALNHGYGDQKITGFVHPFRLAGFANVKDKHRNPTTGHYPFVKLLHKAFGTCTKLLEYAKMLAQETMKPSITTAKAAHELEKLLLSSNDLHSIVSFTRPIPEPLQALAESHYRWCYLRYGDDINHSVADYMLSQKAIKKGFKKEDIAAALAIYSPDLLDRHPKVHDYISRTITAAGDDPTIN